MSQVQSLLPLPEYIGQLVHALGGASTIASLKPAMVRPPSPRYVALARAAACGARGPCGMARRLLAPCGVARQRASQALKLKDLICGQKKVRMSRCPRVVRCGAVRCAVCGAVRCGAVSGAGVGPTGFTCGRDGRFRAGVVRSARPT